jgi:hypothetical protein
MRIRHTAAIGVLCLTIAGCTTVSQGEPIPAPSSEVDTTDPSPPSGSEDDLPSHGAPKVKAPLDTASRFEQDPCSILTTTQAQELDLPATGKQVDGALGLDCEWFNPTTRGEVTISSLTNNRRGLSGFYDANQRGEYPYFTPLPPIEGYPAITADVTDRRPDGVCVVVIGVTDQLTFGIALQLSQVNVGSKDPCEIATLVAGMALRTMKEGA